MVVLPCGRKGGRETPLFPRTENYHTIMPGTEKKWKGKWKKIEK